MQFEVHKFGGTSQSIDGYKIINNLNNNKKVIVLSAIKSVTNMMIELINGKNNIDRIININKSFAETLNVNIDDIISSFKMLSKDIIKNKRRIIGYGEYFTVNILDRYLKNNNKKSMVLPSYEIIKSLMKNEKLYNDGPYIVENKLIFDNFEENDYLIVPGFSGVDCNNDFCLMGRGGSDTTGSIIASSINARMYYIWTDVNGIYTIDPRINDQAQMIENIDYNCAQELAAMGARVIHPYSILPCKKNKIPIKIKNTFNPDGESTTISDFQDNYQIYSLTRQNNISYFKITSLNMWNNYGFVTDIFKIFSEMKIDVNIINTSQFTITTTTDCDNIMLLKLAKDKLEKNYNVELYHDLSLISVVGNNIHKNKNLDKIFKIVKNKPILMTSYSSNDMTISFLIEEDNNNLINNLHKELFGYYKFDFDVNNNIIRLSKTINDKPIYIYDYEIIKQNVSNLKALSNIDEYFYAVKANYNENIIRYLSELINFETVSLEEIELVRNYSNNKISFTPNFISIRTIEKVFNDYNNIDIVMDNIQVILDNPKIFENKKIGLRIDLNCGHGHHTKVITQGNESKFGITFDEILKNINFFEDNNIIINGIHTHMGSGIDDYKFYIDLIRKLINFIFNIKIINDEFFNNLEYVNLGGGFNIDMKFNDFNEKLGIEKENLIKIIKHPIKLRIEPGRYVVANSGYIMGKVTQIKTKNNVKFIGCNIGMNDIMRPALYHAIHPIKFISNNINENKTNEIVKVVGPICESGDVIIDRLHIEKNINIDDIIIIKNTGAYCESMASNYNCRNKIESIFIENINKNLFIE